MRAPPRRIWRSLLGGLGVAGAGCCPRARRRTGSSARPTCRSPCGCSAGRRRSCWSFRSSRCRRCGRGRSCRSRSGAGCSRCRAAVELARGPARRVGVFALVVYSGFAGAQVTQANFSVTFIYVIFWVGAAGRERAVRRRVPRAEPVADVRARVLGADRARAAARATRAAAAALSARGSGVWPAIAGIVGFAWLELVYVEHDRPVDARGAVARLLPSDARGDGAVRRGGVELRRRTGSACTSTCSRKLSAIVRGEDGVRLPAASAQRRHRPADPRGHGGVDLHADRHDDVRRLQQRRHLAQQRAEPAERVRRTRLQPHARTGARILARPGVLHPRDRRRSTALGSSACAK